MPETAEREVVYGPWHLMWLGPADDAGRRGALPARRDAEVSALLDECGDGTAEHPWDTDALVAVAKHMRARAIVHDQPDTAGAT